MFASDFVDSVLCQIDVPKGLIVLDPWVGTGTTTESCNKHGLSSVGLDVNPVMVIIAKGRTVKSDTVENLYNIAQVVSSLPATKIFVKDDPLCAWFCTESAAIMRSWVRLICHTETKYNSAGSPASQISLLSNSTCFLLAALFQTVRSLSKPFKTTNPTWTKTPRFSQEKLQFSPELLRAGFLAEVEKQGQFLKQNEDSSKLYSPSAVVVNGTSDSLPLDDKSVYLTLTSPPYCTRLDYAKATELELALLEYSPVEFRQLRELMIGTPLITEKICDITLTAECNELLDAIRLHPSRASQSYYYKTFKQYFTTLARSLNEISRVTVPGGHAILVVQDSYYKEIHIDLASVIRSQLLEWGWEPKGSVAFEGTSFRSINTRSRQYQRTSIAKESVLHFTKVDYESN